MQLFLLIGVIVAVSILVIILVRAGGLKFPWIQFYIRGKESGFSFSEISLLRKVAVANRLKQPTSLFWSVKTLDRCIRSAIVGFRSSGAIENPSNTEFLNKLFDYRARVEFLQPKYRLGLSSTRGITPGQTLKIVLKGGGVYLSKLVETNRRYMAITYPRGKPLPPGFSWKSQDLKIHFWRKEDAGYYFETRVIGDYLDRKVPILHVGHVDSIVRTQKRRSVRRQAGIPASLYPLKTINQANENEEQSSGYRSKLLDISEDGAAMAVGGKVKSGLPVKVQARPNEETLILNGVVKSATYQKNNNTSILHIEGQRPSNGMRIKILVYVYGLFESESASSAGTKRAPAAPGAERKEKNETPQEEKPIPEPASGDGESG